MELIFVYNAQKGGINAIFEGVHKVVKPSTYPCDLCTLTHGALGRRQAWKHFLKELNFPISFHYLNTLPEKFLGDFEFPAVLRYENSSVTCILDRQELASLNEVEEFIVVLKRKIPELSEE